MSSTRFAVRHTGDVEMTAPRRKRAPQALWWLGGTAVFGITASALYATTGFGFPAPFRTLTGWDCPFCGGTRMGAALLHLDPIAAFWFNPAAFIALILATLAGGWLIVEWITGRRGQLAGAAQRLADRLHLPLSPTSVTIAVAAGLVAWTLFRNLVLGPLP